MIEIIRRLRRPGGCPWDREQTPATMKEFLLEEAREVQQAVESGDPQHVCEELGDVLMIVIFLADMAEESGTFDLARVLAGIADKLVARHPHVFSAASPIDDSAAVVAAWKRLKSDEKVRRERISRRMAEVGRFVSALTAAHGIQNEAARVGFDFPDLAAAWAKIVEEAEELRVLLAPGETGIARSAGAIRPAASATTPVTGSTDPALTMEVGDLLFSVVNVARLAGIDADAALRMANQKFVERFARLEDRIEREGGFVGRTIDDLDRIWNRVKTEKGNRSP